MRALLLLSTSALMLSCGTSPMDFCHRSQEVTCEQLYRCSTDTQRAAAGWADTYGTDQASCAVKLKEKFCPADTNERVCGGNPPRFDGAKGDACLDDVQRATCEQSATAYQDSSNCAKVCGAG